MKLAVSCLLYLLVTGFAQRFPDTRTGAQLIVDTEMKFSEASRTKGFSASNFDYAADNAIVFRPYKINALEHARNTLADDSTFTLTWHSTVAFMAKSGDLGYASGPFKIVSHISGSKTHGQFVTVWKKQADQSLKFIMDFGSGVLPGPAPAEQSLSMESGKHRGKKNTSAGQAPNEDINAIENQFSSACSTKGDYKAFLTYGDANIMFFRQREYYVSGLDQLKQKISDERGYHIWSRKGMNLSQAGDLAHVYGTHQFISSDQSYEGYFMRLWKKDPTGQWKIVVAVSNNVKDLPVWKD